MLKYQPVIAAFLLLLSSITVLASEALGSPNGTATLSINGIKFEDSNRNAIFDIDERGLSEWVIRLKLNGREVSNTTTNASGRYSFTNLRTGNYTVTEDQQAGWEQSVPGSGYYTINLSDKSAYKVDFGNFRLHRASSRLSRASDESVVNAKDVSVDSVTYPEYTAMPIDSKWLDKEEERYKKQPKAHVNSNIDTKPAMARGSENNP